MSELADGEQQLQKPEIDENPIETAPIPETVANQGEYSSEYFKIELKNLPRSFGFADIKKFLNSLNLKFVKIKAPNKGRFAFITFQDEAARDEAMKVLNGAKYKNNTLEAVHAKPIILDPTAAKRKNTSESGESHTQVKKLNETVSNLSLEERVQNSSTPLWKLPYEKQIEEKSSNMKHVLRKTLFKMERANRDLIYWWQKQKDRNEGMCCSMEQVVHSVLQLKPVIDNYRNKCEFSIGYNSDETETVIGFRLGDYKSGSNEVAEPFCCRHIPSEMKSFIRAFKAFMKQSKYTAFNVRTNQGNWRQLTLRTNQSGEVLGIVIFDKHELTDNEINEEKLNLSEYFKKYLVENDEFRLKGLLFNLNTNKSGISKMDNLDLLIGEDFLYENLLNLKFRISPLAFFQSNTKAAELLYQKIGDICEIDENTILLDICCGTGTIGLVLAHRVKQVVGVEIIPEAIEDAKLNAKLNNIENVEYHCGKAEEVLPNILRRYTNERVVAIVDPPRAGLHAKVVQALRRLENLSSLVYVSCNAELAQQNFVDLSRESSKQYHNQGFVPLKAIVVDMFPHTSHCELILHFKRYTTDLYKNFSS